MPLYRMVPVWCGLCSGTSSGILISGNDFRDSLSIHASALDPPQEVTMSPTGTPSISWSNSPKKYAVAEKFGVVEGAATCHFPFTSSIGTALGCLSI